MTGSFERKAEVYEVQNLPLITDSTVEIHISKKAGRVYTISYKMCQSVMFSLTDVP